MAVTTMVFYGRLKNAVGDIFSKDNVAFSRWVLAGRDFASAESVMGMLVTLQALRQNIVTGFGSV